MFSSYQLQRQRESHAFEEKHMDEELATLSQRRQTLRDGAFMERVMKPDSSNMSVSHVF